MKIQVLDNISFDVGSELSSKICRAEDTRIAVAFVTRSGLSLIESALNTSLQSGGYIEFLVGLDMCVTSPAALRYLYSLGQENRNLKLYCYTSNNVSITYHPKVYIMRDNINVSFMVGSSNLTAGGLQRNVEANLTVEGNELDEVVLDIYQVYKQLKFSPNRVIPDEEFVEIYAQLFDDQSALRKKETQRKPGALKSFSEKVKTLQRPRLSQKDLVGWARLVYAVLPAGEFTNDEIYKYEDFFKQKYPDNKNIRAKIRQQLQVLESEQFVEHIARGVWCKK
ncbi:MAG: phospholipase D-like domain-containing protein [Chloroflexota bacterium]|nr:phospholipase D-like domain-containing protein [Chloroflexota bacterium]